VVGFFLWVIRNFVRGLRQKDELPAVPPIEAFEEDSGKKSVDWPVHIFIDITDDIPIPGKILSVTRAGAFMESSACLSTGQVITLYVDAGDE